MSVRVNIEPAAVFKKPPVIQELLLPGWEYGTWDKGFSLQPGEIGTNTLVYETDKLARGINLERANYFVSLTHSDPTSRKEIYGFYEYLKKICEKMNVKKFTHNGLNMILSDIDNLIDVDIDNTKRSLTEMTDKINSGEVPVYFIFGVKNPIAIDKEQMEQFGSDIDKFAEYLDKMQHHDYYYAAPISTVEKKMEQKTRGFFGKNRTKGLKPDVSVVHTVPAGKETIFPIVPRVFSRKPVNVIKREVLLTFDKYDRERVDYDKFVACIDKSKKYDADCCVINLSDEELKSICREIQ